MKKCFIFISLFLPLVTQAHIIRSDLSLLNDTIPEEDPVDPQWNLAWHMRAASYGDPDSLFFLAQVHEQGKLVPKNLEKAIEFYEKAAAKGHLESCMSLARLIPDKSIYWYTIAANQGDPQAQLKLSQLYETVGNYDQAIYWLEKAMHILFPNEPDLTRVSPDLKRLKALI